MKLHYTGPLDLYRRTPAQARLEHSREQAVRDAEVQGARALQEAFPYLTYGQALGLITDLEAL